jgi:hypothetical protein
MTDRSGPPTAVSTVLAMLTAIALVCSLPALIYLPLLISSLTRAGVGLFGVLAFAPAATAGLLLLAGRLALWEFRYPRTAAAVLFAAASWLCDGALWLIAFAHTK